MSVFDKKRQREKKKCMAKKKTRATYTQPWVGNSGNGKIGGRDFGPIRGGE